MWTHAVKLTSEATKELQYHLCSFLLRFTCILGTDIAASNVADKDLMHTETHTTTPFPEYFTNPQELSLQPQDVKLKPDLLLV